MEHTWQQLPGLVDHRAGVRSDNRCDIHMVAALGTANAWRLPCGRRGSRRLALGTRVQTMVDAALESDAMTSGSGNAQIAVEPAPKPGPSVRWDFFFGMVFVLVLFVGVAVPVALLVWQAAAKTAAVRASNAGTFVSATASTGGFFSSALTNVQTTSGSVVVRGTFSAPQGRALAVEELNKTGLHLCPVGDLQSCLPLAGPWAWQLASTPQATKVFDFVGHGLSEYNLQRWLMAGLVFGFIAFAWLLAVEVNKRA